MSAIPQIEAGPMGDDTLLTPRQVAKALTISKRTLERWRQDGSGGPRCVKLGDRRVAYRLGDVRAYVASLAG